MEIATMHRQLRKALAGQPVTVDFPRTSSMGCRQLSADDVAALAPLVAQRKEQIFADFRDRRRSLFDAMTAATSDADRHTAIASLRTYDAGFLPNLWSVQAALGGIWDISDAAARDAVLAAIQLEASTNAQADLLNDAAKVHERVYKSAGMSPENQWCGFFAEDHFVNSNLDQDLKKGYFDTRNPVDYFHYKYDSYPDRILKWIWDSVKWREVSEYHADRGATRKWLDNAVLSAGGTLDIQPGDVVLVDWDLDGTPDHIAMAQSYDPATSTLFTIGGNDLGMVVDNDPKRKIPKETPAEKTNRERLEAAFGRPLKKGPGDGHVGAGIRDVKAAGKTRSAIFGVGRPSLVDFEDHKYVKMSTKDKNKPPPLLTH